MLSKNPQTSAPTIGIPKILNYIVDPTDKYKNVYDASLSPSQCYVKCPLPGNVDLDIIKGNGFPISFYA